MPRECTGFHVYPLYWPELIEEPLYLPHRGIILKVAAENLKIDASSAPIHSADPIKSCLRV